MTNIINVKTARALVDACADWVAANPDAAREMGQRGRAALEKYDLQSIVRLHEAVYQRVLSDGPLQEVEACAH